MDLAVKRLRPDACLPERAYADDAAFDLCAAVELVIAPQERAVVPTGIALGLPAGVAADDNGDIFISDTGNNRIRQVTPDGGIHTIADCKRLHHPA